MKKVCVISLLLLFATAASAFANSVAPSTANEGKTLYAAVAALPTGSSDGTLIGKCSKGVYAGWNTNASGFALITMHFDGNRTFGTAHNATAIYRKDGKETAAPTAADNGAFSTGGWTAM